jgi:hypothetical protein
MVLEIFTELQGRILKKIGPSDFRKTLPQSEMPLLEKPEMPLLEAKQPQ